MSETTTTQAGAQPQTTQPAADAAPPDPRAWLPEEFRGDKGFEKFQDIGALAKSYRETAKFVGADKATLVRLPKDEADAAAWGEVWNKLGRPEKPEGYTFEGMDDMPGLDAFRVAAHGAGLPAKQAAAVAKWYAEHQAAQRETMRVEAEGTLKQEWGAAFDERLTSARKALDQFGGEELREWMERSGFGNHPGVIRMFSKVAQQMAEPGALKGGGSGQQPGAATLAPAEAKAEWDMLQRDGDFMKKYLAGNGPEAARVRRLYAQMHPGMTTLSA